MNLIPCTSSCKNQNDGLCTLQRAASISNTQNAVDTGGCVHYVKKNIAINPPHEALHGHFSP